MSEIYFRYRRFGNRETKLFGDTWDKWHKPEGGRFTARVKLQLRLWLRLRIQENYESSPDELKCLASLHPHNWPQQKCYNWPLSCSAMFGTYVTCNELAKTATTPLERHCNKNCSGKCDYFLRRTTYGLQLVFFLIFSIRRNSFYFRLILFSVQKTFCFSKLTLCILEISERWQIVYWNTGICSWKRLNVLEMYLKCTWN